MNDPRQPSIKAFIQARMSSARFPGKVLAPFRGQTVLWHVVDRVSQGVDRGNVVLATSVEASDDKLAEHAESLGIAVFRGPLDDVFARLRACLEKHPCDWFFRVSADSPLIDPGLLKRMIPLAKAPLDLVTNVFPRTFPKGQSAELLRAEAFKAVDAAKLSAAQREHVTPYFYENAASFMIKNVESGKNASGRPLVVDTPGDLARLEAAP